MDVETRTSRKGRQPDLDHFKACSPVIEVWSRWYPRITCSDVQILLMNQFGQNVCRETGFRLTVDKGSIRLVLDYMLGLDIKIPEKQIPSLLYLADFLQIEGVAKYCKSRIKIQPLNEENCLQILNTCYLYNIERKDTDQYIRQNVVKLCQRKDMLTISQESLAILLADEELSYWPMDDRFVFITDWCSAHSDRVGSFKTWFRYIDLYRIDRDIVEKVVKRENLVRESKECLDIVNMHLSEREDRAIPFMFILRGNRSGPNVLGFNLEDKKLYNFNIPDSVADSDLVTVAESGLIVAIKKDKRKPYIYKYDLNTDVCEKKLLTCRGPMPEYISYMFYSNGRLILLCKKKIEMHIFSKKRGSSNYFVRIHQQINEDRNSVEIELLRTFAFDTNYACMAHSMICMLASTYDSSSKFIFFNIETNKVVEIETEICHIQHILPLDNQLLVSSNECKALVKVNMESNKFIMNNDSTWMGNMSTKHQDTASFQITSSKYITIRFAYLTRGLVQLIQRSGKRMNLNI